MEDLAFVGPSKNLDEAREGLEREFFWFWPSESTLPPLLSLSSSFCLDFDINVERNGFDVGRVSALKPLCSSNNNVPPLTTLRSKSDNVNAITKLANSCFGKSSLHDIFVSSRFGLWFCQNNILSLFLIAKLLERMVTGWITQHSIAMQNVAFVTTLRCNWSYAGGIFDVTACDQHVSSLSDLAISDEIYTNFLRSNCAS